MAASSFSISTTLRSIPEFEIYRGARTDLIEAVRGMVDRHWVDLTQVHPLHAGMTREEMVREILSAIDGGML